MTFTCVIEEGELLSNFAAICKNGGGSISKEEAENLGVQTNSQFKLAGRPEHIASVIGGINGLGFKEAIDILVNDKVYGVPVFSKNGKKLVCFISPVQE